MWLAISWCLLLYELLESVVSTRYYIVVPTNNLTDTSAHFKQKQRYNSSASWECEDGKNPIVHPIDETYKIQANSINLSIAETHHINCIGLNVQVVKKNVVYVWDEGGGKSPGKGADGRVLPVEDGCFGFITSTDSLEFNEQKEEETVTIHFQLSPLTVFDVYLVEPRKDCIENSRISIPPPTVHFDFYNENFRNDKTSLNDEKSLKPTSCVVLSDYKQNISCNMSLLAKLPDGTEPGTFSTAGRQTHITVPRFIWGFSPTSITCRSHCVLSHDSQSSSNTNSRIASQTYDLDNNDRSYTIQHQTEENEKFYQICSYVLGGLVVICGVFIISLTVWTRRLKRRVGRTRRAHSAQNFSYMDTKTRMQYSELDAGEYSRLGQIRPTVHRSLPVTCNTGHRSLPCNTERYNSVSLKISEFLDTHDSYQAMTTEKLYEKITNL